MPEDRFFHPRLRSSAKVSSLTCLERCVWEDMVLGADDFGVLPYKAAKVRADNDMFSKHHSEAEIKAAMTRVVEAGLFISFEHQGQQFVCDPLWMDFQKIQYPRRTYYPSPDLITFQKLSEKTQQLFIKHSNPLRPEGLRLTAKGQRLTAKGKRPTANGRARTEVVWDQVIGRPHVLIDRLRGALHSASGFDLGSAAAFHDYVEKAIRSAGLFVRREVVVPDRGDGESGRIDLLITDAPEVAIELDWRTPRGGSLLKLDRFAGLKVVVLREMHERLSGIAGIDAIFGAKAVAKDALVARHGFDVFWAAYPKKASKEEARAVWDKGTAKTGLPIPALDVLLPAITRQKAGRLWVEGFIPNPATWLRNGRWQDEVQAAAPFGTKTAANVQAAKNVLDKMGAQ